MHKLLIGVVAATLTIAACGGSSKKDTSVGGTVTTASKTSGGATDTTAKGGSDNGGGGTSDFAKAKIKITYAESGTSSGTPTSTTLTIAQDGNGKSSFSSSEGTDPSAATTIYSDGTTTVDCSGTGTAAHCTTIPSTAGGVATTITASFAALASVVTSLGGGDKSSETIAGRDAACVKYKAADVIGRLASLPLFKDSGENPADYDATDSATICLDKQTGFPLKFSGTKKGVNEDTLTATAFGEPTDADFTPPVTPQTTPSFTIPGGGSVPTIPAG